MFERGEAIRVARRLRAAVNLELGFIDLKACLKIAEELEKSAEVGFAGINANASRRKGKVGNRCQTLGAEINGSDLMQILSLKSLGEALLIETLLMNPGQSLSFKKIANILSAGEYSARVAISNLRFHFKKFGFGPVISNRRGEGYYISERTCHEIHEFIDAWKRSFLLDALPVT